MARIHEGIQPIKQLGTERVYDMIDGCTSIGRKPCDGIRRRERPQG